MYARRRPLTFGRAMSRRLARRLRLWLLPILVLGVLLRPVLIIACDIHAATHGHNVLDSNFTVRADADV